ncbi:hypothetical protein Tco_0842654 [Tanacetum coccineum]|uniref:CCHC-type domain-containing protein n=1 Tax=Tanacetum coccineum TaxID=301880 RepID=A0ABQ5B229_9ASTR
METYSPPPSMISTIGILRFLHGFLDGTCLKESYATSDVLSAQWDRCDAMGGSSVADYYHRLNSLWRDFDSLTKLPKCTCEVKCSCDASKELGLHQQLMKLMQFLIGLDDCYHHVRSSLLTRDPLPEVKDTYNVVSMKESHRRVPESFGVTESKQNATSFVAKTFNNNRRQFNNNNNNFTIGSASNVNRGPNPNLNCKHCGKLGHTIDRCFEIVDFPQGFKRNSNSVKQSFNANVDVKMSDNPSSSSLSSGFTPKQMQKLLSMINDKPSVSIHTNMASRDSFFNGQSNVVMSYHVSKLLWHNRLGHPADQVRYVLKNDLSIIDNTFVPLGEVCQRAKQTTEPFPLSDHKSKSLVELSIMADPVFINQVSDSIDHAPSSPQKDIVMTNAATKTIAPEVVAMQVRRRRLRLVRHDDMIDKLFDQLEDMSLDRMEAIEYDVETLEARVDVADLRVEILQLALANAREEIMDFRTRDSALEQRAQGPQ